MKFLGMLLGVFACANVCVAQDAPERHDSPPGLVIVKLKRERRVEQIDVKHTSTDPDALNNGGMIPTSAGPFSSYVYEYSVEIRNDLPNKIRWLSWTYSLRDPDSKQELDRQEFVTFERISPGQGRPCRAGSAFLRRSWPALRTGKRRMDPHSRSELNLSVSPMRAGLSGIGRSCPNPSALTRRSAVSRAKTGEGVVAAITGALRALAHTVTNSSLNFSA